MVQSISRIRTIIEFNNGNIVRKFVWHCEIGIYLVWTDASIGVTVAGESGVSGPWAYQLSRPSAVLLDDYSNLFILDSGNGRILKWPLGWTYGISIGSMSSMNSPYGMYFNPVGDLVVADTSNHRIISFEVTCCKCSSFLSIL